MTERHTPRNTSAADPWEHFAVAAFGGIEVQEAQGQREVLNSTTLPTQGSEAPELLELGFTFGDVVPGDDLFREATLPEGWKREGSDHAMHSYICDERGQRRVNVFYKAAFYDRRADMHVMNVGADVATHAIYGDGKVTVPDYLTDDEKASAEKSARRYIEDAEQHPDIYADRLPRAQALLALVTSGEEADDGQ